MNIPKTELKRHEEAIADYDKAIELQPDNAVAYYNKGKAQEQLGDVKVKHKEYAEAERYYREAMADHEEAKRKDTSLSLMVRLVLQKLQQKLENLQSITGSIAKT